MVYAASIQVLFWISEGTWLHCIRTSGPHGPISPVVDDGNSLSVTLTEVAVEAGVRIPLIYEDGGILFFPSFICLPLAR